jgi:hypothetical protein
MKGLFWIALLIGIGWLVSCSSLVLPPPAQVVGQSAGAVTPADNPTAGHAITPNQFDRATSIEWLWDQNGVYLLDPGSSVARELFGDNQPIANLQGVTYSFHHSVGSLVKEFYAWLWTPIAVYRYSADGRLMKVQDAAAQDIKGVQNIVIIPGPENQKDAVLLWTANNFYQLWSTGEQTQFVPSSQAVPGVHTIKALPNPNSVLLWNVSDLYLYDLNEHLLHPIINPVGSSLTGVQGIWIEPPTDTISFIVWVWNNIDLYRLKFPASLPSSTATPAPSTPTSTPAPHIAPAEKILNPMGGGINQVQGVTKSLMGQDVEARIWIWTVDSLYYLPTRQAVQTEAVSLAVGDVRLDSIKDVTNCPSNGAPVYVWNARYLFEVNPHHKTVKVIVRPDGLQHNNNIRRVVACPMRNLGLIDLPDDVWWWDDDGVYRRVNLSFPASAILFADHQVPQIRGLMIGMHPKGQLFWFWSDTHVYQYLPDKGGMQEVFAPDGTPLVNVWMVLMRPDLNEPETGYTILIRNQQGTFQYMQGNERVSALTAGDEMKAIISPAYQITTQGMVMVGQSALLDKDYGFETTFTTVLRAGSEDAAATILIPPGRCEAMPPGCEE